METTEAALPPVKAKMTAGQAVLIATPSILLNVLHALTPNAPDVSLGVGAVFGLFNYLILRSSMKNAYRYGLVTASTVLSLVAAVALQTVLMINSGKIDLDKIVAEAQQKATARSEEIAGDQHAALRAQTLEEMNDGYKALVKDGNAMAAGAHFEGDTLISVIRLPLGKKELDEALSADMHEKLKKRYDCSTMRKLFDTMRVRTVMRYEEKSGAYHVEVPVSEICGVPPG